MRPRSAIAQLPFGLVDGGDEVVSRRSDERCGEAGDPRPIVADAVGDDRQLGRRRFDRRIGRLCARGSHGRTIPTAPLGRPLASISPGDQRSRRPSCTRGVPLGPGRRGGASQHQRIARTAAGRVPRCVRRRAVAGGLAPVSRSIGARAAHGHRRLPRRVAGAGVRGQRLERGAADRAARVRGAGADGGDVRADLSDARADRPGHRGDRRRGPAWRGLHPRPTRGRARDRRRTHPTSCSSRHPTTRRASSNPPNGWSSCSS